MARYNKLPTAEIVALSKTMLVKDIAAKYGVRSPSISRVLKQAGVVRKHGENLRGNTYAVSHGLYRQERLAVAGLSRHRYLRLLAVVKLGGHCATCKIDDLRVLDINHINGKERASKDATKMRKQCMDVLRGKPMPHLEVRCCNCNRLHEYERGLLAEIPAEFYKHAAEFAAGKEIDA